MHFIIVGINHKTAKVQIREQLYFPATKIFQAYSALNSYDSIKGSVILSTCNRVEIYAAVENVEQSYQDIEAFICKFHQVSLTDIKECLYKKRCEFAVTHLFKVASGLDSMVIGEYQIQGQVRDAYFVAFEQKFTEGSLNKLFQTAIQIGKKVRSETEIGKGKVSVATLAIDLIKQIYHEDTSFKTLLVGAGKMSNLTAANLKQLHSSISVTNRSREKAVELSTCFDAEVIDFENRYEAINSNDIIIVSTSAADYSVTKDQVQSASKNGFTDLKVFIDLSIPRNIDPAINDIENCILYSIDDINKLVDNNINARHKELDKAEKLIDEIAAEYYEWYATQHIIPLMKDLKKDLITLKQKTLQQHKCDLAKFDDEQRKILNNLMDNYSDNLIKVIMNNFKKSTPKEDIIDITSTLKDSYKLEIEK